MAAPESHHPDPHLDALLAGYVLGDLGEQERQELRAALAGDPSLEGQLEELRLTLELLPMALPEAAAPPAQLRRRLLKAEQQRRRPEASGAQEPNRGRWPRRLALAAMAGAVVALGTQVQLLRGEMAGLRRNQSQPAAAGSSLQASRTLTLRGTEAHPGLSGEVVVTPGQGHNQLLIRGLPPAPPSHVYRLWANVGGSTKGCVRFVPGPDGSVVMPIPSQPSSAAQSLSITLEPLRPDASTPDGPRLLTSV